MSDATGSRPVMGEKTDSIDEKINEIVFDVEAGQLDPRLAVTRLCRLFKVHNRISLAAGRNRTSPQRSASAGRTIRHRDRLP